MKTWKKAGLTALAGSLVASSAFAGASVTTCTALLLWFVVLGFPGLDLPSELMTEVVLALAIVTPGFENAFAIVLTVQLNAWKSTLTLAAVIAVILI